MARRPPKPAPIVSGRGTAGNFNGRRRFLTSAQFAHVRRKRADLDAKLWQMTKAERERR